METVSPPVSARAGAALQTVKPEGGEVETPLTAGLLLLLQTKLLRRLQRRRPRRRRRRHGNGGVGGHLDAERFEAEGGGGGGGHGAREGGRDGGRRDGSGGEGRSARGGWRRAGERRGELQVCRSRGRCRGQEGLKSDRSVGRDHGGGDQDDTDAFCCRDGLKSRCRLQVAVLQVVNGNRCHCCCCCCVLLLLQVGCRGDHLLSE